MMSLHVKSTCQFADLVFGDLSLLLWFHGVDLSILSMHSLEKDSKREKHTWHVACGSMSLQVIEEQAAY